MSLGQPIPIGEADEHIAGYCLLNDWSARDIQAWEYQPLGPFLAKNFLTSVSPWMVTAEALAPFRKAMPPRPAGDPQPLPYLDDRDGPRNGALAIELEVTLSTEQMRARGHAPHMLSHGWADAAMYWSAAQIVTHHSANGCNLQPGDLIGTGTLSTDSASGLGSLLEISQGGKQPLDLPSGETRSFLEDGDEVTLKAWCEGEGAVRIGFGECVGRVVALSLARGCPPSGSSVRKAGRAQGRDATERAISRGAPSNASSSIGRPASTSCSIEVLNAPSRAVTAIRSSPLSLIGQPIAAPTAASSAMPSSIHARHSGSARIRSRSRGSAPTAG